MAAEASIANYRMSLHSHRSLDRDCLPMSNADQDLPRSSESQADVTPSAPRAGAGPGGSKTLVTIATYNEIENLPRLVEEVFRTVPQVEILVIDDHSPDGTGEWCDRKAAEEPRLHCIHRPGKLGLGTATIAAMRYAVEHGYDQMLNMDADFSHHPRYLPDLLNGMNRAQPEAPDVMIGSRYVAGGGVEGWPLRRRLMSRAINWYARCLLGLPIHDCSGAFRCYRCSLLARLDFDAIRSRGYAFEEEVLWHLKRLGSRFGETPIIFADRRLGSSKINSAEAATALWTLFRLGLRNWLGI